MCGSMQEYDQKSNVKASEKCPKVPLKDRFMLLFIAEGQDMRTRACVATQGPAYLRRGLRRYAGLSFPYSHDLAEI